MSFGSLSRYILGALGYSLISTVLIIFLMWILSIRPTQGRVALVLSIGFVVFLGMSPFPDINGVDCSEGGVAIQARAFAFVEAPIRLWSSGASLTEWATDLTVTSSIMNLLFFMMVGSILSTQTLRLIPALIFSIVLTCGIELSQYTGVFGIYPCRYRTVDIDDIFLNVVGVMMGMAIVRWLKFGSSK